MTMPHFAGSVALACRHDSSVSALHKQQYKAQGQHEYSDVHQVDDERSLHPRSPRFCRVCFVTTTPRQHCQPERVPEAYEDFERRWWDEWAPKISSLQDMEPELPPLRNLLHQVCPHLRSVSTLQDERFLKRVYTQLKLEGLNVCSSGDPIEIDKKTRDIVTGVVEDQLHMHRRYSKLRGQAVGRGFALQKAEVAMCNSLPPRTVYVRPKRATVLYSGNNKPTGT
jgi:hypothetical protein